MFKYVPNILTIARFFLIPFIVVLIMQGEYIWSFIVLTLSGLTDVLDGCIARKFNFITNFGKLMDPLADKATQISILVVLSMQQIIPFWILIVVILKEFVMISGASFLYGKEFVVSSRWYGKLATVLFYIAIAVSLCIRQFSLPYHFDQYLYYLAVLCTIFSLAMYFKAFYMQGYFKKENMKIENKGQADKK